MSEGHTFVPSRDSKITRLLAAYLQGNCKTMVLATVSPTAFNMTESVCTMEFAQNAAAVKNTVRVNNTATRAVLMKELRLAKETAEERCVELEAKVQALLQLVCVCVGGGWECARGVFGERVCKVHVASGVSVSVCVCVCVCVCVFGISVLVVTKCVWGGAVWKDI